MKTILKRNQLVILVIALVLVTAGYLNYTSMNENNENTVMTSQIVAELGDATLVSSTDIENEEVETTQNEEIEQIDEQVLTSATTEDTYYTSSKLERDNMFSQLLETYQEVYNNVNSTAEQRNTAISEMAKINELLSLKKHRSCKHKQYKCNYKSRRNKFRTNCTSTKYNIKRVRSRSGDNTY